MVSATSLSPIEHPTLLNVRFLRGIRRLFAVAILSMLVASTPAVADVILPKIIGDHMVLQRGVPAPVWGWADSGEEVTVEFGGQVKKATPGADRKWMVTLDPLEASSEPRVLTIQGKNKIAINDVLVGEVWLAAGQSNMEWTFNRVAPEEWTEAQTHKGNNLVRAFHVSEHLQAGVPMDDTIGRWRTCPDILEFSDSISAVGFFFALTLQKELGVPVAILDSNWGGQRIETFIPVEGFKAAGIPHKIHQRPQHPDVAAKTLEKLSEAVNQSANAAQNGIKIAVLAANPYGNAENFIHNAMVAPLTPYAIRGAIWYQGESNRGANDYFQKLQALSAGWSHAFVVKNIPLIQVQIAPFYYSRGQNLNDSTLCDTIWTAQYRGANEIPGMGIVPIHDTNIDIKDIHPKHKKPVGERLAAHALKHQYGKAVAATGPRFDKASLTGDKVIVSFVDIDQGLTTPNGEAPTCFELSVDGKTFAPANAVLEGNTVVVASMEGTTPKFVRMGWKDTAIPNLKDKNGWPVFAFPSSPVAQ